MILNYILISKFINNKKEETTKIIRIESAEAKYVRICNIILNIENMYSV